MLLEGKKILVTGVLTPQSIAFAVAKIAQEEGAEVALTGFGRGLSLTEKSARRLPHLPELIELDVTEPTHFPRLGARLREKWGRVDGALHAIAFAPSDALGGNFLGAPWESVQTAFRISTFSFKELAAALLPLLPSGGSLVTLDFDNTVAWPAYDWMGVAKAALESLARYLARDLGPDGVRVNLVAAGPVRTIAARSIPSFSLFEKTWSARAPLGWSVHSPEPVARACVALLSEWFPMTTGEIVHVDGGFHAMGA